MRIQDIDFSKQPIQLQELLDNLKSIINNGNLEIEFTAARGPTYQAPSVTKLVFSLYGSSPRLYVSYMGSWFYANMTLWDGVN